MNKFHIGTDVRVDGKWGGTISRIVTLEAPKWKPEQGNRYMYYVHPPHRQSFELVEEERLEKI
jgi:hypothetical protein